MDGRRRSLLYGAAWLGLLALLGAGVWWLLSRAPNQPLRPGALQRTQVDTGGVASPSIDESFGMTDLTLRGAEMTVSSSDGALKMRVWADAGVKEQGTFRIEEGALQFTLGSRDTLILKVNNATYRREANVVRVRGTLIGYIPEGGQYFKAAELSWDQDTRMVATEQVRFVGPNIDVTGERMRVNLDSGVVKFEGPVEVGI